MRALLFFILLSSVVCLVEAKADPVDVYNAELQGLAPQLPAEVQAQLQLAPEPYPQPQPQIQMQGQAQAQAQPQLEPQPQSQPAPQPQPQLQLEPEPYPQPQPQIQPQPQLEPQPQSQPAAQPQPDSPKNPFAFAFKSNKEAVSKEAQQANEVKAVQVQTVDTDQLQKIIDSLPAEDKRTISAIKAQIATWPKEVFDEITAYREFVINSRKIAKQKYLLLSPEAKSALEAELQIKAGLSPSTASTLENLQVETRE